MKRGLLLAGCAHTHVLPPVSGKGGPAWRSLSSELLANLLARIVRGATCDVTAARRVRRGV